MLSFNIYKLFLATSRHVLSITMLLLTGKKAIADFPSWQVHAGEFSSRRFSRIERISQQFWSRPSRPRWFGNQVWVSYSLASEVDALPPPAGPPPHAAARSAGPFP